jgi:hypothetical protein
MNSLVRIVKRQEAEASQCSDPEAEEQKAPTEREIAITIKSWVTDWEQRRRMTERTNWDMLTKFAQ